MSVYAELKTRPDFCYTCLDSHTEERHQRRLAIKRDVATKRRARPDHCMTCNGKHDEGRHQQYVTRARLRREAKLTPKSQGCSTCQGSHDPRKHDRANKHRRRLHTWETHCITCHGPHDRTRHRRKLAQVVERQETLRRQFGDAYCHTCKGGHKPGSHGQRVRHLEHPKAVTLPLPEFYPFVEGQGKLPAMLTAALKATYDLPESIRGDICQDLIVNMLAGDLEYADLAASIPAFVKRQWGDWARSLEAPYYSNGTSLRELI